MAARPFWKALGGSAPALVTGDGGVLSHDQLAERAERLASAVAAPDKTLALVAAVPDPATIVAYLGLLRAGHAVMLMTPDSPARTALIATYRPSLLFGLEPQPGYGRQDCDGVAFQTAERPTGGVIHPDLAVMLTTSGSTGSPKLVRCSHAALAANATQIVHSLRMKASERAVTTLSPAYSFGLSVINSHLACGGSLLLTGRTPLERDFWSNLERHAVTTLPGVPFTFEMMRRAGAESLAPATLRKLLHAGGPLSPSMGEWIRAAFAGRADLFVMYGQTEATARIAVLPPEELEANAGSVGRPVPGGRIEIDGEGQIVFHGPNVMMGYAETRDDLGGGDQLDGVLATGDLGRIDEGGRLWITGRLKRIAKPFGLRLNLDDLEARLNGLGGVAVIGDDSMIQVVVEGGDDATIRTAIQALATELRLPASLLRLKRVDHLPRTDSGKIDYRSLGRV